MKSRRRFGQHFLEGAWVAKLVETIAPASDDCFLEIGPGTGALTFALAPRCRSLVAIEIDRTLAARLSRTAPANVRVVTGDVLKVDIPALLRPGPDLHPTAPTTRGGDPDLHPTAPTTRGGDAHLYPTTRAGDAGIRVVGNLPYYISSPILFRLLQLHVEHLLFRDATLLLQGEVVDRIVAPPGSRVYGVLSVLTELHADASRLLTLPPGAFRPAPRVTSALLHLRFRAPAVKTGDPFLLEQLVRVVFQQRRKTLVNALKPFAAARHRDAAEVVARAGLDAKRRPETLQLTEFARLADQIASSS
ncbi:MAG: 16S rRNA (adenine(1518)-N(6)/adenine(1519)-N(6))-dimethyltransferase [Acidobacteria bacterium]|nr:16S rRNA (adenine(1518)-N(6)/adenine(1519)-N(6))-dimethyltransferase [Acidobacteriota bacterium]